LDITPYRLDKEIIRETMLRITNDFEFFGIQLLFSGNEEGAYEEMSSQLIPIIENISLNNISLLMQIYTGLISVNNNSKNVSG
jgi:hypothetical protein